jgi:hypothetical protein
MKKKKKKKNSNKTDTLECSSTAPKTSDNINQTDEGNVQQGTANYYD